jgi:hypothetical protein
MTLSLPSKKLGSLLRTSLVVAALFLQIAVAGQQLAAYHDNQNRFFIFDKGKTIQAEYLPVKSFSVGGRCILYIDNRNHLKMYYQGEISTLEVNGISHYKALDYLSVYSLGGIVKIVEEGKVATLTTHALLYQANDSIVTFYDTSRRLLAVYYKGRVSMLEDGLTGKPYYSFGSGDNLVAYVEYPTGALKIFYNGETIIQEPNLIDGVYKAGRGIVAYVNPSDQRFKAFYQGKEYLLEEFPPESFTVGDEIVVYVDNTGSFKIFSGGEITDIASFVPDFYEVHNQMVIYGEQGYFKAWYGQQSYQLETFIPEKRMTEWNTIVYIDINRNVKVFSKGELSILTYDLAEEVFLYRDVVVVNKGMNNHNVYWNGKKY